MAAIDGDINEKGDGNIILAYMFQDNNKWKIRADFRTHNDGEDWTVDVLCVIKDPNLFLYREFNNLGDNITYNTNIRTTDYLCGIVGIAAKSGDINEDHGGDIIRTFMYREAGTWWVRADFRTHNDRETWDVNVLCASTDIAILK